MKFFLSVLSAKGHLNPLIPVAQALEAMGHEVGIYSDSDIRDVIARAGLRTYLGFSEIAPPRPNREKEISFAVRKNDKDQLRQSFKANLIDNVPARIEPIRRAIHSYNPDMVLIDPILYPSVIAASLEEKKWAALSGSLNPVLNQYIKSDLLDIMADIDADRQQLFESFGLPDMQFRGLDCISPFLTTCFATRDFIGYDTAGVNLVGPSKPFGDRGDEEDFSWDRLVVGKKKILISFGSELCYQPDYFRKIIDAFRFSNVQLIIAAGKLAETPNLPRLGPLPPDTIVVSYAPQRALLEKVDLFISHGGANSVMEALTCGVPLLLTPLSADQPHQLWFVKNAGVGEELDLAVATADRIRTAALSLIDNPRIHQRLKTVSKSYQKNGAQVAAGLCVQAAQNSKDRSAARAPVFQSLLGALRTSARNMRE